MTSSDHGRYAILVTCEHGGNRIPDPLKPLFRGQQALLNSHRGLDLGILPVARAIARALKAPFIFSTISRLVCDLNRSLNHPSLFSEITRPLSPDIQQDILARHYHPYREHVIAEIERLMMKNLPILHLSIHSFTPGWKGKRRTTDLGLLYDPARSREAQLCRAWRQNLQRLWPEGTLHLNRPYRGTSDGLIPALRHTYPPSRYVGVEVELNQALTTGCISDLLHASSIQGMPAKAGTTNDGFLDDRVCSTAFRRSSVQPIANAPLTIGARQRPRLVSLIVKSLPRNIH